MLLALRLPATLRGERRLFPAAFIALQDRAELAVPGDIVPPRRERFLRPRRLFRHSDEIGLRGAVAEHADIHRTLRGFRLERLVAGELRLLGRADLSGAGDDKLVPAVGAGLDREQVYFNGRRLLAADRKAEPGLVGARS